MRKVSTSNDPFNWRTNMNINITSCREVSIPIQPSGLPSQLVCNKGEGVGPVGKGGDEAALHRESDPVFSPLQNLQLAYRSGH